jgi:serine/threonine protein kinase
MGADAAAEEQFGPYLVYERLGVGGMATVHRALERGIEGFERIVALKRLLPHLAADASFIKSFVREAKLASLLNHVNIVQIFELGRVGTQYFISMEHIDGRDIRRILRHARKASGPPPIHVTVGMLLQLCDALDYAHHKVDDAGHPLGLVHRDVSPSNVLVTSAGQIKVIDFGIAKAQSAQLRTQTNRVKGKLAYMAPEALAGKDLDARSDLFAVGVIGHELLTARPLFATKNEYQTLIKVQRGDIVAPSTFNAGCPPELDAIVLRALARDPDDRFRHASDLRDALNAMRKQYNLQTTNRDIATWLEWAFSLEVPSGNFAIDHPIGVIDARSARHRLARHKRSEEDEAVDLAWGGGEDHNTSDPLVLDDVPDVTDKHLSSASSFGADVRLDFEDLADDIPASGPSHGIRPSPVTPARPLTTSLRPPRARSSTPVPMRANPVVPVHVARDHSEPVRMAPSVPMQAPRDRSEPVRVDQALPAQSPSDRSEPVRTRPRTQDDLATPNAGVGVGARTKTVPPRVRTITIPPLANPAASSAPRTVPSLVPPPPASPTSAANGGPEAITTPRGMSTTSPPPQRRASSPNIGTAPARPEIATERTPALTEYEGTTRPDTITTERTPVFSVDEPSLAYDTMPTIPAMQSSGAMARFRAPTNPPEDDAPEPATRPGPTPVPTSRLGSATPALSSRPGPTPAPTIRLGSSTPAPVLSRRPGSLTPAPALTSAATSRLGSPTGPAPVSRPGSQTGPAPVSRPGSQTGPAPVSRPGSQTGPAPVSRPGSQTGPAPVSRPGSQTGPAPVSRPGSQTGAPTSRLGSATPAPASASRSGSWTSVPTSAPTSRLGSPAPAAAPAPPTRSGRLSSAPPSEPASEPALARLPESPSPLPGPAPAPPTRSGRLSSGPPPEPEPSSMPASATPTPASPGTPPPRLVTPATELFADPDPDPDPDTKTQALPSSAAVTALTVPRASSNDLPQAEVAPRRRAAFGRVLVLLVVLVLAGAVGTAVALYLTRVHDLATTTTGGGYTPPPHSKMKLGTLRLLTVPADTTIAIAGQPVHVGSPWDVDLDPGHHQIEIHRDGYKVYLASIDLAAGEPQTLRVVLDPVSAAGTADAMLPIDAEAGAKAAPEPPVGAAPAPPVPDPPPAPPEIVTPTAKLSGRLPSAAKLGGGALPAIISARLCIDEAGQVTSSDVLTELPARAMAGIADALRTWHYAPYKVKGAARPACFIARVK